MKYKDLYTYDFGNKFDQAKGKVLDKVESVADEISSLVLSLDELNVLANDLLIVFLLHRMVPGGSVSDVISAKTGVNC